MKVKKKTKCHFIICLFIITTICQDMVYSAELDVTIEDITTSTIKISLPSGEEEANVEIMGPLSGEFIKNTTTATQWTFVDLLNGQKYDIDVEGKENKYWNSNIVTAECPENWIGFQNSCYMRENKKRNWFQANEECNKLVPGAHLADPRTAEEFKFVNSPEILTETVAFNWIGINLDGADAQYTDGSQVTEEVKVFKEEDDRASENCAVIPPNINNAYKWKEAQCEVETYFICEYPVPQYPTEISIETSEASIEITWKKPETLYGSIFTEYILEFLGDEIATIPSTATSFNLSGLKAGHHYNISLSARHSDASGKVISRSANHRIPFITNPNPPRNLRWTDKTPTSITITWQQPEPTLDNIFDRYCIVYGDEKIYVNDSATTHTIEDLEPYIGYNIKIYSFIKAKNLEKLSKETAGTALDVITDVSPVSNLKLHPGSRHETNYTISWDSAEGIVDSYEIKVEESGSPARIFTADNSENSFLIPDLIPGQIYEITVVTSRLDGKSDPASLSERTRPPINHVHVQIKDISVDSLKVEIFEAQSNHEEFYYDGYLLTFSSLFGNIDHYIEKVGSGITSSSVTDLVPGSIYKVNAYTISDDVKSVPSNLGEISMELSPPEDFRVLTKNETSILVGWSSSRGEVSRYLVTCDKCHDDAKLINIDEPNEAMFLNLHAGDRYIFTIASQTSSNRASEQVELITRAMPNSPQDIHIDFVNASSTILTWLPVSGTKSGYQAQYEAMDNQYYTVEPVSGTWYNDVDELQLEGGKVVAVLHDVTPGISYNVSVFSVSDETLSKPALVNLSMKPNSVENVEVEDVGEHWSTITWNPGFGGYTEFLVEIKMANDGKTVDREFVTQSRYNSTLPIPASLYYASIYTLTLDRRWTSLPAGVFIQTRPLAVTDVEVYDVSERSFTVRWNPPKSSYDSFLVLLSADGSEDQENITSMSYVKFNDLIPGTSYNLKIYSIHNDTKSKFSTVTATLYPLAPTNLMSTNITSTSVTINWEKPIGRADSYLVQWTLDEGTYEVLGEIAILTGLTPGQSYNIEVFAKSQNEVRRSEKSAQIILSTEEALPGPPIFESIEPVDPTTIDVFWIKTPKPNGKIIQHTIRYKQVYPHTYDEYEYKNFTATAQSGRLENMEPGAWYVVGVRAQNSKGPGEWTEDEFTKNMPSTPGPVSDLVATPEQLRSLTITWNTPDKPNGYILKYMLSVQDERENQIELVYFYRNMSGNPFKCYEGTPPIPRDLFLEKLTMKNDSVATEDALMFESTCPVTYVLDNLDAYTQYTITVNGFTAVGEGITSTISSTTLEEIPSGPPRNIIVEDLGPTYISLSWNPPRYPNGEVTYSLEYVGREGVFNVESTNDTTFTMEGLGPYAIYACRINAGTKAGLSNWTDYLMLNTTQDVPDEPLELSGKVMNSKSVYLNWQPPNATHGIVTSYEVDIFDVEKQETARIDVVNTKTSNLTGDTPFDYRIDRNENFQIIEKSDEEKLFQLLGSKLTKGVNETIKYLVQHLNPYTLYEFRVSAVTSAGPGNYSAVRLKTAEDKPGSKPTNLRYVNISSTSVNLTWSEPESPNGAIVAYEVLYISDDKELRFEVFDTTYAILSDLKKYSSYLVFVSSRTSAGRGPSEVLEMRTDEDVPETPPINLKYLNVTPTVAIIEWDPPLIPNGVIQHYTVFYRNNTDEYSKQSNTTNIYLDNLRVYGEYWVQVSASTRVGDGGLRSSRLYVRTGEGQPGSPPYDLSYKNMTSSSVVLSWKQPLEPNGIIQYYVVTVTQKHVSQNLSLETNGPVTEFQVDNLTPDNSYIIYVHAHTKHGDGGVQSDPLRIRTLHGAPGTPPEDLSYRNISSKSVELSWNQPKITNGQIEKYTIYYNDRVIPVTDITEEGLIKTNIDNLDPFTTYQMKVSASTKAGEGPKASITVYTDEDFPGSSPRDVTYVQQSSSSISLSWKPPSKPNGIIVKYLVKYSIDNEEFDVPTDKTNVTLSNLKKYATYFATVSASTTIGEGPSSSPIQFQTLQDAPSDPPRNVKAISEESTSILVSWEPPTQPNGIIQFYTIYVADDAGKIVDEIKVNNGTSKTIENLEKFTWYNIHVTASTALGDGGKTSDVIRIRTNEGVPDTPVNNLKGVAVNSTFVIISWDEPSHVTGLLKYIVTVYMDMDPDSTIYNSQVRNTEIIIGDLQPYTNYTVMIAPFVEKIEGRGPSATAQFQTLEDRPGSPVQDLAVVNITHKSVVLLWKATAKPNGIITSHVIDIPKEKIDFEVPGTSFEYTINDLHPHTTYVVTVAPRTTFGAGPKASINFTTLEGLPEDFATNVQVDEITSEGAAITWDPPSKPNGQITGYKLVYHEMGDDNKPDLESEESVLLLTPETKYILENIKAFTSYKLVIYSSNSAGMGAIHSLPVYFTTLEDVPSAPILECNAVDQHNIALTWDLPENPNGEIISYTIEYHKETKPFNKITNVTNGDEDAFYVTGLIPYTFYVFEIQAETKPGKGEKASCKVRTGEGFASEPRALHTTNKTNTSLTLHWLEPNKLNGKLVHYAVFYQPPYDCWKNRGAVVKISNREVCKVKSETTSTTIAHLKTHSIYTVRVGAVTGAGLGEMGLQRTFKTLVGAPKYPPQNVRAEEISSTAINVTWAEPLKLAGPTSYKIVIKLEEDIIKQSELYNPETRRATVDDLDKDTRYAVHVIAVTSAGEIESEKVMVRTMEDAPGDPPAMLRVNTTDGNSSTVIVEFLPPNDPNGAIYEYNLQYRNDNNDHNDTIHVFDDELPYTGEPVTITSPHWIVVANLLGGRRYYFRMNAATQEGTGPWSAWSNAVQLPVDPPPEPNVTPIVTPFNEKTERASSTLRVDICGVFSDENGPLVDIIVIVAEDGGNLTKKPTYWFEAYYSKPSPPYMVRATSNPTNFCNSDRQISNPTRRRRSVDETKPSFVLGQDETCETTKKPYCNGPLKSNTPYRLKLRGTTTNGEYTETEFSDPVRTQQSFLEANMYLIVGLVVGIVVFILFVAILVCIIRKRYSGQSLNESQRSERSSGSLNKRATSSIPSSPHNMSFVMEPTNLKGKKSITRPVAKSHFPNHVTRMSAHNDKGFASEFEEIESVTPFGPKTIGSLACNKSKNRFAEIIPYDHYRVKIENMGSIEGSGYINASYIPGSSTPEQYIATQSPLGHTKNDFWRMVWETGSKRIIMLGNVDLEGNDHCTKYWPSATQTTYYGNISVQSSQEERLPEWTIRNFNVGKNNKRRQLTQYHFTMWPVRGVPDNPQPLVRFLHTVRGSKTTDDHPTVVMCSTGSGRSAVFIALDLIMESMDDNVNIDPCGIVADLRNYRPYMVQTAAEYSFLHRCLSYIMNSVTAEKPSVRSPTGDGEETTMF